MAFMFVPCINLSGMQDLIVSFHLSHQDVSSASAGVLSQMYIIVCSLSLFPLQYQIFSTSAFLLQSSAKNFFPCLIFYFISTHFFFAKIDKFT